MPRVWSKRDPDVPPDAVYVGRPTKWGNPYKIGQAFPGGRFSAPMTRALVIEAYEIYLWKHPTLRRDAKVELAGKDLVCWCAPQACHADVLLRVANGD